VRAVFALEEAMPCREFPAYAEHGFCLRMLTLEQVPARFVKPANGLLGLADAVNAGASGEAAGRAKD
jgi:hypothetical protein